MYSVLGNHRVLCDPRVLLSILQVTFASSPIVFDNIEVDLYGYFGFTILVTLLWALVVEHLAIESHCTLVTLH